MSKYRALFIEQSREHLEALSRALAAESPGSGAVDEIFRHVHSIKGMAASMGYDPIARLAHRFEDVVGDRRARGAALDSRLIDALLEAVDVLVTQVAAVAADKEPSLPVGLLDRLLATTHPEEVAPAPKAAAASVEKEAAARGEHVPTVRVRTDVLDNLIDAVGELIIKRAQLRTALKKVMTPDVRAALDELDGRVRDVQARALAVRMTPLRTLTDRYPRVVRDTARSLGKDVRFVVEGEGLEMDRAILENLDTPFVHTIRNAIDHGIESAEERVKAGKPAQGTVTVTALREHDIAVITIADDGRGLDADLLVQTALKKGLLSEAQASLVSKKEAFQLVCLPRFSTKDEVTDISGRGVGMDAVRAHVDALGGVLDIDSELGVGTRLTMRLPLTLSIIDVLRIDVAGRRFAVPLARVAAVRDTDTDVINGAGGQRFLSVRQALAPLHELSSLLGLVTKAPGREAVVVEDGRNLVALAVDKTVATHEVVVKPVGWPLEKLGWISGATVLSDGHPILIIDLAKLVQARIVSQGGV